MKFSDNRSIQQIKTWINRPMLDEQIKRLDKQIKSQINISEVGSTGKAKS